MLLNDQNPLRWGETFRNLVYSEKEKEKERKKWWIMIKLVLWICKDLFTREKEKRKKENQRKKCKVFTFGFLRTMYK